MITLTFEPEKTTVRTIRFVEVLPTEFASPKVGYLYVQKGTLGEMGYQQGENLTVTIAVSSASGVPGLPTELPKPRSRSRKK